MNNYVLHEAKNNDGVPAMGFQILICKHVAILCCKNHNYNTIS